ncbi:hypothetical protein KPL71_026299 [Citrus sinensis]|uniref:Uncharacterized protein n=1 Tax=Citrus sinensis TaxID=2711 RepID=A0ACB8HYJ9_CITSI|nr:hypothetical protein KPL71_026299 [Citrus sinensis]
MSLPKHEIEKFTIGGDFSLWKLKMRALLVHQGLESTLEKDDPEAPSTSVSDEKRKQIQNKAHSTLILSLSDSILREISEEKTALGIWNKVEALCMKKSLAHKLFLKKRLYTFLMKEGVSIQDHIDTFNKIILDLEGVENVKISDEDKAFFLLSSLPKPYEGFVDTMLYGRTSLTLEDVKASLCSKEIHRNEHDESNGEGLVARKEKKKDHKSKNQWKGQGKNQENTDKKKKKMKCFYCRKEGHYIRDCAEKKKKESQEKSRDAAVASDDSTDKGYQSADLLIASKGDLEGQWVLDSAHRAKFPKGVHRTKHVLDYVHTDLWGLAQVVEKFKVWKALVENQSGRKLKALRTNNGLEFCNKEFEAFCQKHGILRHKTVRFTPQQNGLAERMDRTIVDKTRCMLINLKLPRCFWAEAVSTACYLVNKSPSAAIDFKTPEEIWSGRPPKFENLRIFGCPAYVHINQASNADILANNDSELSAESPKLKREFSGHERVASDSEDMVNTEDQDTESPTLQQTDLQDYQLARDRERRQTKAPDRLGYADLIAFALVSADEIAIEEPGSYSEAISGKDCDKWFTAMQEEMDSLQRNKTWTLVPNPGNRKLISCKWIFKKKEGIPEVEPSRYKARLVARGCTQREGIYFTEIFSPVVKHSSIRIILARVALLDMELEQMDVKTAFLHRNLEEQLLMKQPEDSGTGRFDEFMLNNGYHRSKFDNCVYYGGLDRGGAIYLLLYVDDMLIASKQKSEVEKLKNLLKGEFEMKDLGSAKRILGMEIFRNRVAGTLFLSQEKYIKKVLERFDMHNSKPVLTPLGSQFKLSAAQLTEAERAQMDGIPYAQDVGSLMYAMVCTTPDIAFAVSVVSRFLSCSNKTHWGAVKWIMRYLRGSSTCGLLYGKSRSADVLRVLPPDSIREATSAFALFSSFCNAQSVTFKSLTQKA